MYYLHMLPVRYYHEVILPLTNEVAVTRGLIPFTWEDVIHFHGCVISMLLIKLPERRDYWAEEDIAGIFPPPNFGR